MATAPSSPTARRWELAARLRQLRTDAGKTIEEAATELMCSTAKISRMETGGRGVLPRDVRDLCRFYGVPDTTMRALVQLANDSKKPGWWQDLRTLNEQRLTFIGLEAAAVRAHEIETRAVPGLLQSSEYTAELLKGIRPAEQREAGEIEELIASRVRRQKRLLDGSLDYSAVIDEAVFRRTVGTPQAMIGQIGYIIVLAGLPNTKIRLVPFGAPAYPGIDGSYEYLGFDNPALPDVIFVEGMLGNYILDSPADVQRYLAGHQDIIDRRIALSCIETLSRLHEFRQSLANEHARADPPQRSRSSYRRPAARASDDKWLATGAYGREP